MSTEWAADYARISSTQPEVGTILSTFDGSPAKLTIEVKKGASPFIFGRAYVPDLFGEELGWFLQDEENDSHHGFKCVLLPRARTQLIQKTGLGDIVDNTSYVLVKSLKIIKYSYSGNSILCEVHEYVDAPEEDAPEEDAPENDEG